MDLSWLILIYHYSLLVPVSFWVRHCSKMAPLGESRYLDLGIGNFEFDLKAVQKRVWKVSKNSLLSYLQSSSVSEVCALSFVSSFGWGLGWNPVCSKSREVGLIIKSSSAELYL